MKLCTNPSCIMIKSVLIFNSTCIYFRKTSHIRVLLTTFSLLCVFKLMTVFLREELMRSGKSDSFTSLAGRTTVCHITPPAFWGLLEESSPRPWPMPDPWWFTAGWCALKLSSLVDNLCFSSNPCVPIFVICIFLYNSHKTNSGSVQKLDMYS